MIQILIQEGYFVIISIPDDERKKIFSDLGCIIEESNLKRFGKNLIQEIVSIIDYIRLIKRNKPDLILTYTMKPNIYGGIASQICHVPYISNVTGLGIVFQKESKLKKIIMFLQKLAFRKAQCVFFQNNSNKLLFEKKGIAQKNARLLPGSGVNLSLHHLEPYPINAEKIKFITISRARKDKGFDELFEAIRFLSKHYSSLEFHLIGWIEEEIYKNRIDELVNDYPVIYHGSRTPDEVHHLIAQSHCLIHPSYHEGMSNVILEASASGRPCIASDIPGCQETIEQNKTGFLFQVKDVESFLNAIQTFLQLTPEQMREMGLAARKKMEREFNRNIVIDSYLKEVKQVLCNNKEFLN